MPVTVSSTVAPMFGARIQQTTHMPMGPVFGNAPPVQAADVELAVKTTRRLTDRLDQALFNLKNRFTPLSQATFTVIDTETTGLDPHSTDLIEVTAIQYKNGKEVGKFTSLVKPNGPIPQKIQDLTHITDDMVADAPPLKQVMQDLVKFVGKNPLIVGHYVNFDLNQLRLRLDQVGLGQYKRRFELDKAICTKTLGQVVLPELKLHEISGSLIALGKHLGIINKNPHRSESDVRTTGDVLFALADRAKNQGQWLRTVHDLMQYQGPAITEYDGRPRSGP